MTIHTDCRKVQILARDIGVLCLAMLNEAKELEHELTRLKQTLGDDGMELIEGCLSKILDELGQCQSDMTGLTKHLITYAAALRATK